MWLVQREEVVILSVLWGVVLIGIMCLLGFSYVPYIGPMTTSISMFLFGTFVVSMTAKNFGHPNPWRIAAVNMGFATLCTTTIFIVNTWYFAFAAAGCILTIAKGIHDGNFLD